MEGRDYKTGDGISVALKGDAIASVKPGGGDAYIAPGLVDLQINGFRGLDFNTLPVPDDLPGRVTRELWTEGVTSYLATIITNASDAIEECVAAIARACSRDDDAATGIAGIHLEGPFIAKEDGPRGAHDRRFVTPPDWKKFSRWQKAAGGRIRLITMSPEWPGSIPFIRRCVAAGVTVSIGHTAATPKQIREAVAAGASMSTHLGNGSHLMLPRHPNYVWEQL
jgi:N-acetylglucosamine-6-phosphate deacetylase